MAISTQDIIRIAHLSRLRITAQEIPLFSSQLNNVLEYFSLLQRLDTEDTKPTNQVTGLTNVFRDDVALRYPEDKKEKLFREAPLVRKGFIVVPHSIKKYQ